MSNNRIVWEGLTELREQLRRLPAALAQEAQGIVTDAAQAAKADIVAAYPERTGNLRQHVTIGTGSAVGRFGASVILFNNAKHAWIFENGSVTRKTHLGAHRGEMPPGNVFIPRVIRHRRRMWARFKALLTRHGLTVSGEAA